jgi:zinc transport system substrate-binding protein
MFAAINVTVSILPEKYFVKKIAGDLANVQVMVKPGSEPATYEPKPKQLSYLSKSKLYFAIGVPFEKNWLKKFKDINPNLLIVDISKNIHKRSMNSFYDMKKNKEQKSDKNSLDPHIWLSPKLVKTISKNISNAFVKIDPIHKETYLANLKKFYKEIDDLDIYSHKKLDKLSHREFIVFHPVWGYFADEFGLRQIPIQIEGKNPTPKTLIKLINYAKKNGIKTIFVQPQFSEKSARVIAKNINGKVVAINPLEENWQKCIKNAVDTFDTVLK